MIYTVTFEQLSCAAAENPQGKLPVVFTKCNNRAGLYVKHALSLRPCAVLPCAAPLLRCRARAPPPCAPRCHCEQTWRCVEMEEKVDGLMWYVHNHTIDDTDHVRMQLVCEYA